MRRLTKIGLFGFIGLVILIVGITIGVAVEKQNKAVSVAQVSKQEQKPPTRAELLKLVNEQRAKAGVAPLKEDSRLDASAQIKSDDMLGSTYYGHMKDGIFVGQRYIDATGITCQLDSENLDENSTAQAAVKAWVNSKPHFEAMINPKYTLTGFGVSGPDKSGYYLFTEHFCQP